MALFYGTSRQIRAIEKAVAAAFSRAGISAERVLNSRIAYTNLPWQHPPIIPKERINYIDLYQYYHCDMTVDAEALYDFWKRTLQRLYVTPKGALDGGVYYGLDKVMGKAHKSQQRFRFSVPFGYPNQIDSYAGAMLSLEVADLASSHLPLESVRTENSYYSIFPDGRKMGIENGLPIDHSLWDVSIAGAVWDFLEMPRGQANTTCMYDALAKIRSMLYENKDLFPDFQAVDYAIQALRLLYTDDSQCGILKATAKVIEPKGPDLKTKKKALEQSIGVMYREDISDRVKIDILYSLLVPVILSENAFRLKIYNTERLKVSFLALKVTDRIKAYLKQLLADLPEIEQPQEIP